MTELNNKSIHELRGMAAAFGVPDVFQKDAKQLTQAIEMKQTELVAPIIELPPRPEYDARLMTKAPSRRSNQDEITEILAPYVKQGLHVKFDDECWYLTHGKKNDSGSIRIPLRHILYAAEKVMK